MKFKQLTGEFVNDETITELPEGAIELTDEEWSDRLGPPFVPTLEDVKAAKKDEINRERLAANQTYFMFGGKQIACDQLSSGDIDRTNGFVNNFGALPPGWPGGWKAIDNSFVSIPTVAAWKQFYAVMYACGMGNFAKAQELKRQVALAETVEQVESIVWDDF